MSVSKFPDSNKALKTFGIFIFGDQAFFHAPNNGLRDKKKLIRIVGFFSYESNTLTDPRAVMIELLDAVIANRAVRTARRPVKHACIAVLDLHRDSINHHVFDSWKPNRWSLAGSDLSASLVVLRLRRVSVPGNYSRVSSRSQ